MCACVRTCPRTWARIPMQRYGLRTDNPGTGGNIYECRVWTDMPPSLMSPSSSPMTMKRETTTTKREKEEKRDDDEKRDKKCYNFFSLFFAVSLSLSFSFLQLSLTYVLTIQFFLSCSSVLWVNEINRELLRFIYRMCSFSTTFAANNIRLFPFPDICKIKKFERNFSPCNHRVFSLEKVAELYEITTNMIYIYIKINIR